MKKITIVMKRCLFFVALTVAMYSCNTASDANHEEQKDSVAVKDNHHAVHEHEWTYDGAKGPDHWTTLSEKNSACGGKLQSPIDLTKSFNEPTLGALNVVYNDMPDMEVINNGHSVQAMVNSESYLMQKEEKFNLLQFHFHCPSEHTIDGVAADAEIHLVHATTEKIAVIGLMVKVGAENPALAKFINKVPVEDGGQVNVATAFNPSELLPQEKGYYTYPGSLTTPPCTETVTWYVMKQFIEASQQQIDILKNAMPANNARPVQAINERLIKDF